MRQFFEELQRRSVVRVAVGYVIVAWVLIQVATTLLPTFGAPNWVLQVFVLFIIMGFWLAMVLAWAYGDRHDGHESADAPPAPPSQRHVATDTALGVLVVVLLAFSFWTYFNPRTVYVEEDERAGALASIAVLAFDDLSPGGTQAYFAEGISEEILNALAQVPELRVAARTSSFSFQDSGVTAQDIGERLNVAFILEGSVRIAGNNMRITAQLIDTATGYHVWSENYDRQVEDIFAVQDDVTRLILQALNDEMGTSFDVVEHDQGTDNVAAYNAYLLGRHHMQQRNAESMRMAVDAYRQAIDLDPEYADAWAGMGRAYYLNYDGFEEDEVAQYMRPALVQAIALDPENALAIATLGLSNMRDQGDSEVIEGILLCERAYELAPDDIEIRMSYVNALMVAQRFRDALAMLRDILEDDPDFSPALSNLINVYFGLDRPDLAYAMLRPTLRDFSIEDGTGTFLGFGYMAAVQGDQETLEFILGEFERHSDDPEVAADGRVMNGIVDSLNGNNAPLEEMLNSGWLRSRIETSDNWEHDDVGLFYAIAGRYAEAVELYSRSIDEGNFDIMYVRQSGVPAPDALFEQPEWIELMQRPEVNELYRLHRAAELSGQWEPLTDDETGELTN